MTSIGLKEVEILYKYAKSVYHKEISRKDALNEIVNYNINKGSAADYITVFRHMLDGIEYQRTINVVGADYFLKNIREDYSNLIFKNALTALEAHLDYYQKIQGNLVSMREILAHYKQLLKKDTQPNFFNEEDIELLNTYAQKPYSGSPSHKEIGEQLSKGVCDKTAYWAELVDENLSDDFTFQYRKMWQRNGQHFIDYTWAKIFKKEDEDKGLFFTIGVGKEGLIIKLDYDHRESDDSKLTKEQQNICKKFISEENNLSWKIISIDKIQHENWDTLTDLSINYINTNIYKYDYLNGLLYNSLNEENINNFKLTQVNPPIPKENNESIKPNDNKSKNRNIDYIKKNIADKILGDNGEKLVIKLEQEKLVKNNQNELAKKVIKMPDSAGYDILSFDEHGNEKHIEVKTTKGNIYAPFYMSEHEKSHKEDNKDKYVIYRLFNFSKNNLEAEYFIIDSNFKGLKFKPIQYQVDIEQA